jgi:hypothetical protein
MKTIDWKDDSTNRSRKEHVVVFRVRTGCTRATHIHVIEKKPSPECLSCGVSYMGVYVNYEREKRNWNQERGMDSWNRRTSERSRTNHKELQREE